MQVWRWREGVGGEFDGELSKHSCSPCLQVAHERACPACPSTCCSPDALRFPAGRQAGALAAAHHPRQGARPLLLIHLPHSAGTGAAVRALMHRLCLGHPPLLPACAPALMLPPCG